MMSQDPFQRFVGRSHLQDAIDSLLRLRIQSSSGHKKAGDDEHEDHDHASHHDDHRKEHKDVQHEREHRDDDDQHGEHDHKHHEHHDNGHSHADHDRHHHHHHGDHDCCCCCEDQGGVPPKGGTDGGYTGPTAMPYLVIPSSTGDAGSRPILPSLGFLNLNLQETMSPNWPTIDWSTFAVTFSCLVTNLGAAGCAAGLAEFYIGPSFSMWNPAHAGLTPAQVKADARLLGIASFRVPSGGTTSVVCPRPWLPGSLDACHMGLLVQVYDFFSDRVTTPFDALNDRHVARNDQVMSESPLFA
jgi:hypothetical protein